MPSKSLKNGTASAMTQAMSVTAAQRAIQTAHPIVVLIYLIGEFLKALPIMYRLTTVVLILPEIKITAQLVKILMLSL